VVNEPLALMGNSSPEVTGKAPTFDNSPVGIAARNLYTPCVAAVARSFEYGFPRSQQALMATGNTSPVAMGFPDEYIYPPHAYPDIGTLSWFAYGKWTPAAMQRIEWLSRL